ncbi:hypothetical protein SmJEL517_g00220 [Synchytrium microbalum]|uniref:DUF4456 domain-containing protein n=1 Tax=Synchytrium microbalum TaxID=1806994 RepID=A0A507CIX4_9FUNG|nr:uncharacterized protein SmJEL517_g00220 [Synchytrium microbalum]TPX38196.1 hypothetical protein SmJEL517_g00220 [Synchytrium microbalum]
MAEIAITTSRPSSNGLPSLAEQEQDIQENDKLGSQTLAVTMDTPTITDSLVDASSVPPTQKSRLARLKTVLDQKLNIVKMDASTSMREEAKNYRETAAKLLTKFQSQSAAAMDDVTQSLSMLVDADHLAKLTLRDFKYALEGVTSACRASNKRIDVLERDLEALDSKKCKVVGEILSNYGKQLASLQYTSPSSIVKQLQNETVLQDVTALENREVVVQHCAAVRLAWAEVTEKLESCLDIHKERWRHARFDHVLGIIRAEAKAISQWDLSLYARFQKQFDDMVKGQTQLLESISEAKSKDLNMEYINMFRKRVFGLSFRQEKLLHAFQAELVELEDRGTRDVVAAIAKYTPLLSECLPNGASVDRILQDEFGKKKTDMAALVPGKRAALLLPTQNGRNRDIMLLVSDLMTSLYQARQELNTLVSSCEEGVAMSLRDLHRDYVNEFRTMERTLQTEMDLMIKEEVAGACNARADRCRGIAAKMEQHHIEFNNESLTTIGNLKERLERVFTVYRENLCMLLDAHMEKMETSNAPKSARKTPTTRRDGDRPKTPKPALAGILTSRGTLQIISNPSSGHELERWSHSVVAWRQHQKMVVLSQVAEACAEAARERAYARGIDLDHDSSKAPDSAGKKKLRATKVRHHSHHHHRHLNIENNQGLPEHSVHDVDEALSSLLVSIVPKEPDEHHVVEIKCIAVGVLSALRGALQLRFFDDADDLEDVRKKLVTTQIQERTDTMRNELSTALFGHEARLRQLETAHSQRLRQIERLNVECDQEARALASYISSLETSYREAVTRLEQTSASFIDNEVKSFQARVASASSASQIERAKDSFISGYKAHTELLTTMTSTAARNFAEGLARIKESRANPSHHRIWETLKAIFPRQDDGGLPKLEVLPKDMEVRIEHVQAGLRTTMEHVAAEVRDFAADLGMTDGSSHAIGSVRLMLKAEVVKVNRMVALTDEQNAVLLSSIEAKKLYWESAQTLLEECEQLRQSIVQVVLYLDGLAVGIPTPAKVVLIPSIDVWEKQQAESRSVPNAGENSTTKKPSAKIKSNVSITSATTTATKKYGASSTHPAANTSLVRAGPLIDAIEATSTGTRVTIKQLSDAYYADRAGRSVRRTDLLPNTAFAFMAKMDQELVALRNQAEQTRMQLLCAFHSKLAMGASTLTTSTCAILQNILTDTLARAKTSWQQQTRTFANTFQACRSDRKLCELQLLPSLTPSELDALDLNAKDVYSRAMSCLKESLEAGVTCVLEDAIKIFLSRVYWTCSMFGNIINASIVLEDLDRPGEGPRIKTRRSIEDVVLSEKKPPKAEEVILIVPTTSSLEWPSLDLTKVSLPTFASDASSFTPLPLSTRASTYQDQVLQYRDTLFATLCTETTRLMTVLSHHSREETLEWEKWHKVWNANVVRIRNSYP